MENHEENIYHLRTLEKEQFVLLEGTIKTPEQLNLKLISHQCNNESRGMDLNYEFRIPF